MIPSNLKKKYPKPITLLLFPCLFQLFWGKEMEDLCVFVLKELPCCLLELSFPTDLARSHRRIFMLEGEKTTLIFRIFSFLTAVSYLKNCIYPTIKWLNLQILLLVPSFLYKFFHLVDFVCSADSVIFCNIL